MYKVGVEYWERLSGWEDLLGKSAKATHVRIAFLFFLFGLEREEIKPFLVVGLRFRVTERVANFRNVD